MMIMRAALAAALVVGAVVAPITAGAQPAGKVYRVGLIANAAPVSEMAGPEPVSPSFRAFVQGLRALGYVAKSGRSSTPSAWSS